MPLINNVFISIDELEAERTTKINVYGKILEHVVIGTKLHKEAMNAMKRVEEINGIIAEFKEKCREN